MSISSVQCPLEATVCYSTAEFKQQTNLAVRSDPAHPQPSKQCVTPQHGPMKGKGPSPKPACNGYHSLPLGTQPQGRPRIPPLKPFPPYQNLGEQAPLTVMRDFSSSFRMQRTTYFRSCAGLVSIALRAGGPAETPIPQQQQKSPSRHTLLFAPAGQPLKKNSSLSQ